MKKTSKILVAVLLALLVLGLTTAALAAEVPNAFKFKMANTVFNSGVTKYLKVPLKTTANNLTLHFAVAANALNEDDGPTESVLNVNPTWAKGIVLKNTTLEQGTNQKILTYSYTGVPAKQDNGNDHNVRFRGESDTFGVVVKDAYVTGNYRIKLSKGNQILTKGQMFNVSVLYAGGLEKTWTTSNKNVATVTYNSSAKTAVHVVAVGPGTATITCKAGGQTASLKVTVYAMDSTTKTMIKGATSTLATNFNANLTITWSSSDDSIVKVTRIAGTNTAKLKALKAGTATITATQDGKTLTCKVTVKVYPKKTVSASNGYPVKLRSSKSTANENNIITKVALGTKAYILSTSGSWSRITIIKSNGSLGKTGWMMSKFLK